MQALTEYPQFILWRLTNGKKLPIDYRTRTVASAHDPAIWMPYDRAVAEADAEDRIGFVFTRDDPFFFLDIDGARRGNTWSPLALSLLSMLPGAAVEVSQSGTGLHVIGAGICPPHGCKNVALNLELYTERRFVALTWCNVIGDAATNCSARLPALVDQYFPARNGTRAGGDVWTTEPVDGYNGPTDDEELIRKALRSQSAGGVFGGRATFAQLWAADADALSAAYPGGDGDRAYDGSSADAALAQHLAFWTGKNCERIQGLMLRSGLVRDKWEREDYLPRTIINAVNMQIDTYRSDVVSVPTPPDAPRLRATTEAQRKYADSIRSGILAAATPAEREILVGRGPQRSANFWLDNRQRTASELSIQVKPIKSATTVGVDQPKVVSGYQYLSASMQIEYFRGCVYIQDMHRMFTPSGEMLKCEQFNATYGGYVFQLDEAGDKTTRKAWEAFTESQVVRFPKVQGTVFEPSQPPGAITVESGRRVVNIYVPVDVPLHDGDPTPFLDHLARILPVKRDQDILMAYMAACVQHKGVKFQWAPLLQGVQGNGKTIFTDCVAHALGERYAHFPQASDIDNKFNGWLLGKLLIGVEDIYVPGHKTEILETLKPMITGRSGIGIQMKGQDQFTARIVANFMFNSNHKDAVRKTEDDRRFAIFYTAQQAHVDIAASGMGGNYFPKLYAWLRAEGYAIVNRLLREWPIPDELNPAGACHRAPETSSTTEALAASLGSVEQEILEAMEEGRPGFAGGWVSSMAVDKLLKDLRMGKTVPQNRRRDMLRALGYDYHPALAGGRVNTRSDVDNGRPRLFVRHDNPARELSRGVEVLRAYEAAQGATLAAERFGNSS